MVGLAVNFWTVRGYSTAMAEQSTQESLIHDTDDQVVALAPHGGEMEPHTDDQAIVMADSMDACSAWTFRAYAAETSAYDEFHETSTEITPDGYQLLRKVGDGFEYGVAFHGYKYSGVYVGGTLDRERRERLAERIETETGLEATVARRGDELWADYGGTHRRNLLNRLAAETLQLEQGELAREGHAESIAITVADFVEDL
ncbi:hypothetical protein BRD00_14375 [Halobacteriales archaeon QS_8_69_26]|nr:MAG: hypothetical protein BRD00_14375 [Halobacteriales archaeon QS_8_69_26]